MIQGGLVTILAHLELLEHRLVSNLQLFQPKTQPAHGCPISQTLTVAFRKMFKDRPRWGSHTREASQGAVLV